MTRETKIGLLVGLAFIIVIGILLSDHLTSTTEPASAPLGMVGPKTRDSLTTMGRPTVPVTIEQPPAVTPRTPVVTVEEMRRPIAPPVESVVGITPLAPTGVVVPQPTTPIGPVAIVTPGNDPLSQLANTHAGELEIVGVPQPKLPNATGQSSTPLETSNTVAAFREYKAVDGDSLGRIAARTMGSSKLANRDAIVRANPSLKDNPNLIVAGKVYLIPTAATLAIVPPAPVAPLKATEPKTEPGVYWYTVKENDSLWSIASTQLGTGNAWTAIKELNKDVLRGGDTVRTNMRLKLPNKPIATASVRD